jgi:hypothetical protein
MWVGVDGVGEEVLLPSTGERGITTLPSTLGPLLWRRAETGDVLGWLRREAGEMSERVVSNAEA